MSDSFKALEELANPEKAKFLQGFFKTGPGQYAEGDRFLGITVPQIRGVARQFKTLPLEDTLELLRSPWHEARALALVLWVAQYPRRPEIYDLYLGHTAFVNNWDLVDSSAPGIVGRHLENRPRAILDSLVESSSLWERRIAILATFWFIKKGQFADTLRLAERLLDDRHDLMHKAVGWMLREVGKRDQEAEEAFLRRHYARMPRTALRYAIERFPEERRQDYLKGRVAGNAP